MYARALDGSGFEGSVQLSSAGDGRGSPMTEPIPSAPIAVTLPDALPVWPHHLTSNAPARCRHSAHAGIAK
jgi:hypothetical protein